VHFAQAEQDFRKFLASQGHTGPLCWVLPEDIYVWRGRWYVKPSPEAGHVSSNRFALADAAGFGVALIAVAQVDHSICCYVFAPDNAEDAAYNFVAPPITMKVHTPLPVALVPNAFERWLARRFPTAPAHTPIP